MSEKKNCDYCFNCKYQDITETEDEWLECCCKIDGHWQNPYHGCENFEEKKYEEDK